MAIWLVGAPPPGPQIAANVAAVAAAAEGNGTGGVSRVHELYTASCGTYICWVIARAFSLVLSWLPQGRAAILAKVKQWCILGARTLAASVILLGLIPLLFGLLLELVVVVPLRVPLEQTPVLFIWQVKTTITIFLYVFLITFVYVFIGLGFRGVVHENRLCSNNDGPRLESACCY